MRIIKNQFFVLSIKLRQEKGAPSSLSFKLDYEISTNDGSYLCIAIVFLTRMENQKQSKACKLRQSHINCKYNFITTDSEEKSYNRVIYRIDSEEKTSLHTQSRMRLLVECMILWLFGNHFMYDLRDLIIASNPNHIWYDKWQFITTTQIHSISNINFDFNHITWSFVHLHYFAILEEYQPIISKLLDIFQSYY